MLLAGGLLAGVVQPASAQPVERSHEQIVETNQTEVCGIPVIETVDIIEIPRCDWPRVVSQSLRAPAGAR